jgi:hypothetical protein
MNFRSEINLAKVRITSDKVVICETCKMVVAEYFTGSMTGRLSVKSAVNRHNELRKQNCSFETYIRKSNTSKPGVLLDDTRLL